jgi:hypothetical protein
MSQRIVIGNEVYRKRTVEATSYYVYWDSPQGVWTAVEDLPYAESHVLSEDPDLSENDLQVLVHRQLDPYGDAQVDVQMPAGPESEAFEELEYDPADEVLHDTGYRPIGPSRSDHEYWNRYGATADPEGEPAPVFEYNVDELDKLVTTALADEAVEGGDMFVTVDIRPADAIQGDLTSVEETINNASLITSVAGEYIVEAEGADVLVVFNANSRDVDKLVPAFLEE